MFEVLNSFNGNRRQNRQCSRERGDPVCERRHGHTCDVNHLFDPFFFQGALIIQDTLQQVLQTAVGRTFELFCEKYTQRLKYIHTPQCLIKCPLSSCTSTTCFL